MKRFIALAAATSALWLAGCSSSVDNDPDVGPTDPTTGNFPNATGAPPTATPTGLRALFQPLQGVLPFPTDLYFSGSTDGTVNISPANPLIPNQAALNALDGFSTTAPIRANFSGALAVASLTPSSVRVVRVNIDNTTKATTGVAGVLVPGVDYTVGLATDAGVGSTILEIQPLRPLVPSTGATNNGYLVLLTNGITGTDGAAAAPDTDYATIKAALAGGPTCPSITNASLNGICRLTGAHLQIAQGVGLNPANVILSFSFSTQATRDTMNVLANPAITTPLPIVVQNTGLTTAAVNPALPGAANLYAGVAAVPYYLTAPSAADPTAPLTRAWQGNPSPLDATSRFLTRFNPRPVATATLQIPILITVPNVVARPPSGWPVLIFQHGITRNRLDAIGVADSFAAQGYVVASIDLPLHGIVDPMNPFRQAGRERTFDLDLVNNSTLAPGPDGQVDGSGQLFVNLSNTLVTRDNLRQAAADLLQLTRSLPNLDLSGDGVSDIDPTRIHFLGHSLGGIVGTVYLGTAGAAEVRTGVLAAAGAGVARTIVDSPAFGPLINAGLAAQGLQQGTTLYNQFLRDAQTVTDAGDAWNYAAAATAARPTLLSQMVGGGTRPTPPGGIAPPDLVVPNSSTARLISAGGFPRISTPGPNAASLGHVNFVLGDHGSIIDPTASLAATTELQTQAIAFSSSLGTTVLISNPAVIQP